MDQRNINIPNLLSALRILFLPFFIYLISRPSQTSRVIAFSLFVLASLTDMIDGYVARRLKQETELGKFLDPLADKLLVLGTLITLIFLTEQIQLWMVMCIVGRDMLITCLRYLAIYQGSSLRTSRLAKVKTAFQMFSIFVILISFMAITVPQRNLINEEYHQAVEAGLSRWDVAKSNMTRFLEGRNADLLFCLASFVPYYLMILTTAITVVSGFRYLFTNWGLLLGPIPLIRPRNG